MGAMTSPMGMVGMAGMPGMGGMTMAGFPLAGMGQQAPASMTNMGANVVNPGLGYANAPSKFGMFPFNNQPVYTVTSIPMITLQIPPFTSESNETIDIRRATQQTIWINENKTIIPKKQSIIYSKEVIIFYVNRRIQRIEIRTFTNPLQFSQLPLAMSNFEKLNQYPVDIPPAFALGRPDEFYQLRSVVSVTQTTIKQGERDTKIITGSTGLIMSHRDFDRSVYQPKYYLYDPFGASLPVLHPLDGQEEKYTGFITNKPITYIEPFSFTAAIAGGEGSPSFFDRAKYFGTVFIYAKPSGYNPNETIYI
jgi:hypothetical protein